MSLSNLHSSGWLKGSYTADMAFLLKVGENNSLRLYGLGDPNGSTKGITPYFDGSIAIGYGFDLLKNSIASIRYILSTVGITLSPQAENAINAARSAPSLAAATNIGQYLSLGTEPTADALLHSVLESTNPTFPGKQASLDAFLGGFGISMADSREKAVLVSMWYQANPNDRHGYFGTTRSPSNLVLALQSGNRAEAWYQAYSYQVVSNAFTDADGGNTLTWSAELVGGGHAIVCGDHPGSANGAAVPVVSCATRN